MDEFWVTPSFFNGGVGSPSDLTCFGKVFESFLARHIDGSRLLGKRRTRPAETRFTLMFPLGHEDGEQPEDVLLNMNRFRQHPRLRSNLDRLVQDELHREDGCFSGVRLVDIEFG
jgi:hypothetical protein